MTSGTNMAPGDDGPPLYQCQCGQFFETRAAARAHLDIGHVDRHAYSAVVACGWCDAALDDDPLVFIADAYCSVECAQADEAAAIERDDRLRPSHPSHIHLTEGAQ